MAHLPAQESDVEKVIRIAKGLDISLEDAAVTCDAFELAFSNEGLRRAIFEIIDQLDDEAAKKGEPWGLILTYAVELDLEGIRVARYADEIPAGQVVTLTPSDRARILLRIKDNFPTQQYLGPIIVSRPAYEFENEELPEGFSNSEPTGVITRDMPVRLTLDERFPFLSAAASESQPEPILRSADRPPFDRTLLASAATRPSQLTSGLSPPL
jgi:hypothetical protein